MLSEFLSQLKILLRKNLILSYRNWRSTLVQLFAPVVFILLLLAISFAPTPGPSNKDPAINIAPTLSHCQGRTSDKTCYSLFYAPNTEDVKSFMRLVADTSGLVLLDSLGDVTTKIRNGVVGFNTSKDIQDWVLKHPNMTQGGVYFPDPSNLNNFTILYNTSCPNSIFEPCPDFRGSILRAITSALLVQATNHTQANITVGTSLFPSSTPDNDAVKGYGILFFYCGSMFFFVILLYQIVYEKEHKLRQGMQMMGLKGSAYWLSWFIYAVLLNVVSTLLIIAVGSACQFRFFLACNFGVLFLIFFLFIAAMTHLAFLLVTLLPTTKAAIYAGMLIFILGTILQLIFNSWGFLIFPKLYDDSKASQAFRIILVILPMFNFAKAVTDVENKAFEYGGIKGPGFTWDDIYKEASLGAGDVHAPATVQSFYYQLMLTGVFTVLAWYLDNVLPGNGSPQPPYFFLSPVYWGLKRRTPKIAWDLADGTTNGVDDDVIAEHRIAADVSSRAACKVLRLTKVYQKYPFFASDADVKALTDLSLSVNEGQIFCLLGHNGAGKTTAISILTGLHPPTSGDAVIYGHSITAELDKVRQLTGVCPQHDILWGELTAREHLELFAELKRVPKERRAAEIRAKLESVNLWNVANKRTSSFSGGMKRRLSVAISCTGDPRLIFMDEPTTGMDPMSRRQVWTLIQQLKRDRVIVLTTHSMEEADVLGDRIAIMSYGRLRCIGSPLHLKNKFGDGYRINITSSRENGLIEQAKEFVARQLPTARLLAETGDFLVYAAPNTSVKQLVPFFQQLERLTADGAAGSASFVRDWSVSHTTLEEVFLKVTREASSAMAATGDVRTVQWAAKSAHSGPAVVPSPIGTPTSGTPMIYLPGTDTLLK